MTGENFANAAPFTENQFDKIFTDVTKNPNVAIVGVTVPTGDNFKILQCCYTTPEDNDEMFSTQLILTAFIHGIAPDVEIPTLMDELTAENSSDTVTKGGVKFSLATEQNICMLTVTK